MNPRATVSFDPFARRVDYLRISVTDRCNERCLYCLPEGYKGWARRPDHLTADEIVRIAGAATMLGFRKFRLTGGEPLVRCDIIEIARRLWDLAGVETLGLSTNGTRLAAMAGGLRAAGIRSVNVSIDALNPATYRAITGGALESALEGIFAARDAGFEVVKLNCVLMRGVNEDEYLPLIEFAAAHGFPLRFIELMPLSRTDVLDASNFLGIPELMERLSAHGRLTPLPDHRAGHGPARYFRFEPGGALLGFIGAITTPDFCATCNKVRLTADGKLRPCLGRHGEIDLLASLRAGGDPADALREAIANKPENHEFTSGYTPSRPMTAIGG